MDQAFVQAMQTGYALDEPGLAIGSPMLGGEVAPTGPGPPRPVDGEPPRPDRRRHRHGQDEDPPAARRPAVRGRRAGLRGRHQGRRDGHRRAGRRHEPRRRPSGSTSLGWTFARRATRSSSCRCRASSAPRSGRPSTRSGRCCSARSSTSTTPRPRSCRWSSSTATTTSCRCSTSRTCARRCKYLGSDDGKAALAEYGGMSPASVGRDPAVDRRRSSSRAPTSSSASPSSTSPTCSGRRPTARASSASSSCPTSWTSPRCSARSCSGCSPSCTTRCPRSATCPSRSCASSSTRPTSCSTTPRKALLDEIERTARLIRSKGVGVYFVTQAPTDVPVVGPRPARQSGPARAAGVHARRRRHPEQDVADLPHDHVLRRRADDPVARDRRGARDRALAERRPDAARRDPTRAARFADGGSRPGHVPGAGGRGLPARQVRHDDRPPERPRDHHRPDPGGADGGAAGRRGAAGACRGRRPDTHLRPGRTGRAGAPGGDPAPAGGGAGRAGAGEGGGRAQAAAERQRQRSIDTGIRTAGRILTSRTGQDMVRSVFGTLFGKRCGAAIRVPDAIAGAAYHGRMPSWVASLGVGPAARRPPGLLPPPPRLPWRRSSSPCSRARR